MSIAKTLRLIAAAITAVVGAGAASAQPPAYPSRAIQVIVPFPAGGSDAIPRKLAEKVSQSLGQPVMIVNKPGASGIIATRAVVDAPPDGYTLYIASPPELAANPSLFENVPYDALADLTPISLLAKTPFVLFARKGLPAQNYEELVSYIKANPGKLDLGTFGPGSPPDLLARSFEMLAEVEVSLIPYRGGAPMLTDLVGGEIDLAFATLIPTRPFIERGDIVPIAVTLEERPQLFPDVPTFSEKGLNIVEGGAWGLMGPKGLSPETVKVLRNAFVAALEDAEVQAMFRDSSIVPVGSTPEDFAASLAADTKRWANTIPQLGLDRKPVQ